MDKPNAETVAWYERAAPADPRAKLGKMFGHPCAFVNGNMFYGTFGQSVVARVGETRAAALAKGKLRVFEPMAGRAWKEYVQVPAGAMADAELSALAREALDWTNANIAPKVEKPKKAKPARA
jgi:hypothetical protein